MTEVLLSLGSNAAPRRQLAAGMNALYAAFGPLACSPVYESESVGFNGENFLNLVVALETEISPGPLNEWLKKLERRQGRDHSAPKFSDRSLDIDILTWGDACGDIEGVQLPRQEILDNAFVLCPLADLRPDMRHPGLDQTFKALWAVYPKSHQRLWRVNLAWRPHQEILAEPTDLPPST